MSFANDKLYNSYLRNNMSSIVSKVKVREIIVHLACLTAHDRETIEAKRDTCGNYDGMVLLLDCLKRRESWPEHFIQALELCEHTSIAAEVRAEYDALRGANNSNPSSPPPAVVKAHVHSAPSSPHISAPEPGRHSQDAAAPPSPPQSTPNATPPPVVRAQTEASTMSPPPEPPRATETPPVVPPFSPDRARPQESAEPERPDHNLQQPEEYSESDFQGILCADPDGVSAGEVSVGCVAPPQPAETAEQCDTDSPPGRPFASDVPSEPSHTTLTPERLPVQDTTPPMDKVAAVDPEPEENLKPPATQIVTCCTQTGSTSASSTQPTGEDGTMCLSVPRPLVSIQPQDSNDTAPTSPPMPYSGNSDRLEISDSAQNTETAEPEENHLEEEEDEEVQVNVVHVTQQPSVLNLDGQCIGNGEASKDVASSAKEQVSTPSGEKCINADVTPADIAAKKPAPRRLSTNAKYIMTAAGVGACALLMAWKLKH